jgi:hydroxymethylbilane synthase
VKEIMNNVIRLGTRGSALARIQTEIVRNALLQAFPGLETSVETVLTRGDVLLNDPLPLIGGKGLFTDEIERALTGGIIDLAVHSLKDLPVEMHRNLVIGAFLERKKPADVLISRNGYSLSTLPIGAAVGTSSYRRSAQLKNIRPDLVMLDIRGNVDSRIKKALDPEGPYDAIVLAFAGLERLHKLDVISEELSLELVLPAPGQAALAVQCRDSQDILNLLRPINHIETELAVTAERSFLNAMGGGCSAPVSAIASIKESVLSLHGRVTALDGKKQIDAFGEAMIPETGQLETANQIGIVVAQKLVDLGGGLMVKESLGVK